MGVIEPFSLVLCWHSHFGGRSHLGKICHNLVECLELTSIRLGWLGQSLRVQRTRLILLSSTSILWVISLLLSQIFMVREKSKCVFSSCPSIYIEIYIFKFPTAQAQAQKLQNNLILNNNKSCSRMVDNLFSLRPAIALLVCTWCVKRVMRLGLRDKVWISSCSVFKSSAAIGRIDPSTFKSLTMCLQEYRRPPILLPL